MKQFSEQELLEKITNSSEEAYKFVFLTLYNELCIYACSIVKGKVVAEEMVQEVFIRLWENRESLSIRFSLKSYLYKAVHNLCINHLQHQVVTMRYAASLPGNYLDFVSPVSPDYPIANLLVQELDQKINQCIEELPDQCRKVFLLIRYEDLSYQEAAAKLGISVNTVKTQLQRALTRLRENLKEYLPALVVAFLLIK